MSRKKPDLPDKHEAIRNWSKKDKFNLLEAMRSFGLDMAELESRVPSKSPEEIRAAIAYYKEKAMNHPSYKMKLKKLEKSHQRRRGRPDPPLEKWLKMLSTTLTQDQLKTQTAKALRMIAQMEDIPPPEKTNNINFRQVYFQLANALEGNPISTDLETTAVLLECLKETVNRKRTFLTPELKEFLKTIKMPDPKAGIDYVTPTKDHELEILRHLSAQPSYYPIKIPEEHLRVPEEVQNMPQGLQYKGKGKGQGKKSKPQEEKKQTTE